jgi:hypothetical protein
MKPIKRGCGERDAGGVYGMCPQSPTGRPVWSYLLDPPQPYHEGQFRGIKFAPEEMSGEEWVNDVLLMDWIGAEAYATAASWTEETRRFGMSRKFPATFPFERLAGKRVWLAVIHKRAIHEWEIEPTPENGPDYVLCKTPIENQGEHFHKCVYHSWGTALRFHDDASSTQVPWIDMEWMGGEYRGPGCWRGFYPWDVMTRPEDELMFADLIEQVCLLPQCDFAPGVFGVFPIKHFEVIKYIPDGCKVDQSGPDAIIVDE